MPNKNGRLRVEKVALELFADKGVASTSTREIARAAGLAEGTLYRHYATKDDLAVALFLDAAGQLLTCMEAAVAKSPASKTQVKLLVATFFEFADRNPSAWQYLMHRHPPLRALPQDTRLPSALVVEVVRRGIEDGAFAVRDPVLGAAFVIGMTIRSVFFLKEGLLKGPARTVSREVAGAALRALEIKNEDREET
ncbi:MAG: TetR/AcrR family transcriptional regulator [Candidatus Nanopelagicales bacterium]|nr:TetR/AcrR family transcriptional regulator [Candidatus Nanopelagicales bacterium]MDZ4250526.1 TetR/AcrR family transcriptional regulator [Candidatus Nanopelagicales bacterium]